MKLEEVKERLYVMSSVMQSKGQTSAMQTYNNKIVPGSKPSLGIRIPNLRKFSKELVKGNYKEFLDTNDFSLLELEILQSFVIGGIKRNIDETLFYMQEFVPKIHDWCVCDCLCQSLTAAREYPEKVWELLMEYAGSDGEFKQRVVAVVMLSHYLNDNYIDKVISVLDTLKNEGYYCKMGAAWAIATIMAKYPDKCFAYLRNNTLDDWTYNKSIQKMIESYRVAEEDKLLLHTMKR